MSYLKSMNAVDFEKEDRLLIVWNSYSKQAMSKLAIDYYKDKIMNAPEEHLHKIPMRDQDSFIKWINNKKGIYRFVMITVNPMDSIGVDELHHRIKKSLKKVYVENYKYCFEWRDGDKGLHCHIKIWVKKGKRAYDIKREFYNTFKHIVGNPMHVNIRYSNIDGCFERYLLGIKDNKEKENFKYDIAMRKKNKLKNLYVK